MGKETILSELGQPVRGHGFGIALWGPIIPIGLGAATLSSAIGSILIAPRTLQALAAGRSFHDCSQLGRFIRLRNIEVGAQSNP
jgi:hypothetical protein